MQSRIRKFVVFFSESGFWEKLRLYAKKIGIQAVYASLLLYFAFKRKETPRWAKNIVIGVLGYLISPLDFLPDLTPFIGYTDDLGLLSFGLVTIAAYINQTVRTNARNKLKEWFGEYNPADIHAVESRVHPEA